MMTDRSAKELAESAEGNIKKKHLTKDSGMVFTYLYDGPLIEYLNVHEQPEYIFSHEWKGYRIIKPNGDKNTPHQDKTEGKRYLLITDQRIIYVAGRKEGDERIGELYHNITDIERTEDNNIRFYLENGKIYEFTQNGSIKETTEAAVNYVTEQITRVSDSTASDGDISESDYSNMDTEDTHEWKIEGEVTTNPIVTEELVVFADSTSLLGVESSNGNKNWEVELNSDHNVTIESLKRLVSGEKIVYGISDTAVIAVDKLTGDIMWESDISTPSADTITDGIVADGLLHLGTMNDASLVMVDTDTGEVVNSISIRAADGDSPEAVKPVAENSDNVYFEGYNPPGIFALNTTEPKIEWTKTFSGPLRVRDQVQGVAATDNSVYVGYMTSVNVMNAKTGNDEWHWLPDIKDVDTPVHTALLAGGRNAQKIENEGPITAEKIKTRNLVDSPIVDDDKVFAVNGGLLREDDLGGKITALNAQSGNELWEVSCRGGVEAAAVGSGNVYVGTTVDISEEDAVGSEKEFSYYVQAFDGESGTERWTLPVSGARTLVAGDSHVYIVEKGIQVDTEEIRAIPHNR